MKILSTKQLNQADKSTIENDPISSIDFLDPYFLENSETSFKLLTKEEIQKKIKPREKFSHKGTYGHTLIIAGSLGKMGACVLSTKAALRSGAGLVTVFIPKCGYEIIQILLLLN